MRTGAVALFTRRIQQERTVALDKALQLRPGHLKAIAVLFARIAASGGHGEVTIVVKKDRVFELRTTTSLLVIGDGELTP